MSEEETEISVWFVYNLGNRDPMSKNVACFPSSAPGKETTDLRKGNIMITREMKSVGGGRLVMSSHDTLDAVRVGTRLLASGKRTLPEVKVGILA